MKRLIQHLISAVVVFNNGFYAVPMAENDHQEIAVIYSSNKLTIEGAPENTRQLKCRICWEWKVLPPKQPTNTKRVHSKSQGFLLLVRKTDVERIVVR